MHETVSVAPMSLLLDVRIGVDHVCGNLIDAYNAFESRPTAPTA